ncbi:hypothetical protein BQ8794_90166 [Mesorhizobium prunaredense]|uniref:Uncharacterized protein n=1 Tax=Mesorhizobium prunaredense TaxID=1631249 RepID=A0A1R3VNF5_9HYPH|nr:hypothetical protein BQ8794_90166 [Mesorhizobium prunaredense]
MVVHLGQKVHSKRIAIIVAQAMRLEVPVWVGAAVPNRCAPSGQAIGQAFAATCIGGSLIGFAFAREAR